MRGSGATPEPGMDELVGPMFVGVGAVVALLARKPLARLSVMLAISPPGSTPQRWAKWIEVVIGLVASFLLIASIAALIHSVL
jgi:hypothetical protein